MIFKLLKVTIVISLFFLVVPFVWLFSIRARALMVISFFCQRLLTILGIEVGIRGQWDRKSNYYIVCNHLSYLDVLVCFAFFPSCFVTSTDIGRTPFLGQICLLAGTVFVNRTTKKNLRRDIARLGGYLEQGFNVFTFPEATSSDGGGVLPFKRALFQAAVNAHKKVLPLTINYKNLDGKEVSQGNKDLLFWYGDMTFGGHFIQLLKRSKIEVELFIGEPIDSHRLNLATHVQEIVSANYLIL